MIAQRPEGAAPVVRASAEELPFEDGSFDAAMVVLSDHHWRDHDRGLAELRRVARRVVLLTWDPATVHDFWLVSDYLPCFEDLITEGFRIEQTIEALGGVRVEAVPVPHDCVDGFMGAYWRRPHAYLDPHVRASISACALMDGACLEEGMARLEADLHSGAWERRHAELLKLEELDLGYRLLIHPP
jgi:SAM-dependent methyltransferase